jgi:uroporphyrinogen decarboxylase
MNSRERTLRAIRHEKPDRPPVYSSVTPQIAEKLAEHFGIALEEPLPSLFSNRISWPGLMELLGDDLIAVGYCYADDRPVYFTQEGLQVNEWGMVFKDSGLYWEFCNFPLQNAESVNDILNYSFPDPFAKGRFDKAKSTISKYDKSHAIIGEMETTIFETCWYLTGLGKFLMDLLIEPPYLQTLLDRVMQINLDLARQLVNLGVDIIWLGDDFGSQSGMIMDPETWRKHFKPRMKYIFSELKKVNPEVKIAWHSCGSFLPIVPDFIEIGLDILNPLQPLAYGMDPAYFKKKWGKQLTFFGAIDIQHLLPFESPKTIKAEVKRIALILGKGGGYILAPAHNIQPDTPVENVLAMYEAVKEL